MTRIKTSLSSKQPKNPWDDYEIKSQAARLWHMNGTAMINPEWIKCDFDRQQFKNTAEKLFGKREENNENRQN